MGSTGVLTLHSRGRIPEMEFARSPRLSLQIISKARGTGKKVRASGIGNVGTTI